MSDLSAGLRAAFDRSINAKENQVDEDLNTLRRLDEQWDIYRRAMRENAERFEEAGHALGLENYHVQRDVAALREVGAFAEKLVAEQDELRMEAARVIRADGETEIERLRNERGALPWG